MTHFFPMNTDDASLNAIKCRSLHLTEFVGSIVDCFFSQLSQASTVVQTELSHWIHCDECVNDHRRMNPADSMWTADLSSDASMRFTVFVFNKVS